MYHWDDDEKYAQATQLLIDEEQYDIMADKLIQHISREFTGYHLLIDVPTANNKAIQYFNREKDNYRCYRRTL